MLFKTTVVLREYTQLGEMNYDSIKSTIHQVEDQHILSILGPAEYNALNAAYTAAVNEAALTQVQRDLLLQCRKVIGPYVSYYHAPKADVQLTDGGVRRQETANVKTAYQYQLTQFREAALLEAENATENLIMFLELNKVNYAGWTASDNFKKYRSLFIKTGNDFAEMFTTHSPYRNYWAMRSKMSDVEEMSIRPFLGNTIYDALKTTDATTGQAFTAKEKVLLGKLKKAIAAFTVAFSIPFLNVRISSNGLTIAADVPRSTNDESSTRSNAKDSAISLYMRNAKDVGEMWLKSAADYLVAEKTDFPTFPLNVTTTTEVISQADIKSSFGLI